MFLLKELHRGDYFLSDNEYAGRPTFELIGEIKDESGGNVKNFIAALNALDAIADSDYEIRNTLNYLINQCIKLVVDKKRHR